MNLTEKKKSIEELYKAIFTIRESLQEAVSLAQEAVNIAQQFGGEIPRVITDQLNTYFIPTVAKYIDDESTPGAMTPLVVFLDSVPLAMTREEPEIEEITPTTPESASAAIASPPTETDVTNEPAEGSYAAQAKKESIEEKKSRKKESLFDDPNEVEFEPAMVDENEVYEDDDLIDIDFLNDSPIQEKVRWKQDFSYDTMDASDIDVITRLIGNAKIGWSDLSEAIPDVIEMLDNDTELSYMINHLRTRYEMSDRAAKAVIRGVTQYIESLPEKSDNAAEESIDDYLEETGGDYEEPIAEKYGVFRRGGSIGTKNEEPMKVFDTNEEAKAYAARLRKQLSPGEKKYYGMSYVVHPIKEAEEKTSDEEVLPTEGLYFVKRKSNGASTLGKLGKIEDQVVFTFSCKEEADEYAETMNASVPKEEKEMFATEYYVEEGKEFKQEEPKGASKKVKVDESTLNFSDGININTDGPLRVTRKPDGYYVVGEGISMPVDDPEEGYEFIKQRRGKVKEAKGRPSAVLPLGADKQSDYYRDTDEFSDMIEKYDDLVDSGRLSDEDFEATDKLFPWNFDERYIDPEQKELITRALKNLFAKYSV